ncbi:hypothetical protein MMC32_008078 [Xylographa parallela]|nr:hypothetical protein [Xylographa parallela]
MEIGKAITTPSTLSSQSTKGPSNPHSTIYGDLSRGLLAKNTRTTWHVLPPEIKRKIALLLPSTMDLVNLMQYDLDLCSILAYSFNLRVNALPAETNKMVRRSLPGPSSDFELMVAVLRPAPRRQCPSLMPFSRDGLAGGLPYYTLSQTRLLDSEVRTCASAVPGSGGEGLQLSET